MAGDITVAEDEDFTWGDFAELLGSLEGAYDQINPPQEIQEYHDANLRAYEALLTHARSRPSEDSFIEEFLEVAFELIEVAFEIGFDTTKSDDEKEQLIEEREQEIFGKFFGSDFAAAAQNVEEARQALPEETLALLDDSGCYPDIISGEEDQAGTARPAPTAQAIPTAQPAPAADDHGDDIDGATAISVGESIEGVVDQTSGPLDSDFFVFQAEAGQTYRFNVSLGTLDQYLLDLFDSAGERADHNLLLQSIWTAPISGDYYLEVIGYLGQTGTYTLTVETADDHGNDVDNATAISAGESLEGVLDYAGDYDFFVFQAKAGNFYQFDFSLGTLVEGQGWWSFYDSDGERFDWDNDLRLLWKAPSSGSLFVSANGPSGATGNYTLTMTEVKDDHGDDMDDATPMSVGESIEGSLHSDTFGYRDSDYFAFEAEAGQTYLFEIAVSSGTLDKVRVLYQNSDGEWFQTESPKEWTAPSSGVQYVGVTGYGDHATYTLTVNLEAQAQTPTMPPIPPDVSADRAALVALYNATDGPNWSSNYNWLSDAPLANWEGVYTDANGRVAGLELIDNRLNGKIPPGLGSLSNLVYLDLGYNQLSGEIPPELGNLSNLDSLYLGGNELSGEIPPELGNLSNVVYLALQDNQLSGEIPPELGNLSNLDSLYLYGNELSGCIPAGLRSVNVVHHQGLRFCDPTEQAATPTPEPAATPAPAPVAGFRLVRIGASGWPEPDLATSWSVSDDGSDWTINLRNDARFPDGSLVTAADAIASIQAWMGISGGLPDIASHSQPDDFTLSIRFE